jgi:hypothetical protein
MARSTHQCYSTFGCYCCGYLLPLRWSCCFGFHWHLASISPCLGTLAVLYVRITVLTGHLTLHYYEKREGEAKREQSEYVLLYRPYGVLVPPSLALQLRDPWPCPTADVAIKRFFDGPMSLIDNESTIMSHSGTSCILSICSIITDLHRSTAPLFHFQPGLTS